ncbi:ATP-binding protein [Cryomorphaceae bacterium 1068]|nr:ATP-binding protein [Cryomorphaceae bacterium 1068]
MSKISVLLISPSEAFRSRVEEFLFDKWDTRYSIEFIQDLNEDIPESDVALLDTSALPEQAIDFLAKSNFQLAPRPIILLVNQEPEGEVEYRTVKSLTADFLVKSRMTSSGLHNTIRYALETNNLKLELEQQQKRYSSLFYNAIEPAFFLDHEFTITGLNDAFLEVFKISKRLALGKEFFTFVKSGSSRKQLISRLRELKSGSIDQQVRFSIDENGVEFLGRLKLSLIRESVMHEGQLSNRIIAYHGTLINISHEERLNAVRKKSEKIAMTYRLARTMAHEIRNPLTNVNLAVDQLKEETNAIGDFEMYFDIIERCTKRIDGILSQLLSSSEQQVFKRTNFDVIALFKEVVKAIKDRSRLEGVELTAQYAITEAFLDGDVEKLRIAFTNLFTNALESMDKESKIIQSRVSLDANYVRIEVEDNGLGMDQQQLESLFDPFFTSKSSGVGLGLTSTQTIISEHQGEIEVESEKGVGSTFSIYLPIDG